MPRSEFIALLIFTFSVDFSVHIFIFGAMEFAPAMPDPTCIEHTLIKPFVDLAIQPRWPYSFFYGSNIIPATIPVNYTSVEHYTQLYSTYPAHMTRYYHADLVTLGSGSDALECIRYIPKDPSTSSIPSWKQFMWSRPGRELIASSTASLAYAFGWWACGGGFIF